jgi:hypothetical protein
MRASTAGAGSPASVRWSSPDNLLRQRLQDARAVAMSRVPYAVGGLPPFLCHLGLGAQGGCAGRPVGKPRQAEQVVRHVFRRMVIGQQGGELWRNASEFFRFGVAQLLDNDGLRAAQLIEHVRREPVRFCQAKIAPRGLGARALQHQH